MKRDELATYLNGYLNTEIFQDYAPNGLQISGKDEVRVICTAVSASLSTILTAVQHKADALLVHHGFFWRGEAPTLLGIKRERIAQLLVHDINLFAFHLPLDCHTVIGNNACIGRLLDVRDVTSHRQGKNRDLLWAGTLEKALNPEDFMTLLTGKFERLPVHLKAPKSMIQHIAWCSGAAQDFIDDAALLGVDAYLSGEMSERTYYQAKEHDIHYFACGHHATERLGVRSLGEHLATTYDLTHYFIDADNPV